VGQGDPVGYALPVGQGDIVGYQVVGDGDSEL